MKTCIQNFRDLPDHRAVDSCVVCLLSHGVEGAIYGKDGQKLQVCAVNVYVRRLGSLHVLTHVVPFTSKNVCHSVTFSWTGCLRLLTIHTVRCSRTSRRCFSSRPAEEVKLSVFISTSSEKNSNLKNKIRQNSNIPEGNSVHITQL